MFCEKCGIEGAKYVEKYNGYLCDFHAQCWLVMNAENERNGINTRFASRWIEIKPWYEYIDSEILEDDEEEE